MTQTLRQTFSWLNRWAVFNAVLSALIAMRYFENAPPSQPEEWGFLAFTFVGHFGLFIILALVPLWLLAALLNTRSLMVVSALWAGLAQSFLFIDTMVYSQYRFHINGFVLDMFFNINAQIIDLSLTSWLIAITCITAMIVLQGTVAYALFKRSKTRLYKNRMWFASVFVSLLVINAWHAWADANYRNEITAFKRHIPLFYPATAKRFFERHGLVDLQAKRDQLAVRVSKNTNRNLNYPLNPMQCSPSINPNVLWIFVDALRADMLNPTNMPNVYAFSQADNTTVFKHHVSGGNSTKAGIFDAFYGLPVHYWDSMTAARKSPIMISELIQAGYNMQIHASSTLVSPAFDRNVFVDVPNLALHTPGDSAWQRDEQITKNWFAALDNIQQSNNPKQPFFGFLFYDAAHGYVVPPDYPKFEPYWESVDHFSLNRNFDPTPYFNRYKTAVHYDDMLVNRVLDDLKNRQLLDNTLVVISSDHGESFNEYKMNFWGHGSNYSTEQSHVPLVVHWPSKIHNPSRVGFPKTVNHKTAHADLSTTVLRHALNCQNAARDSGFGHSLLNTSRPSWSLAGSYTGQAILLKDAYVQFYISGHYSVSDYSQHKLTPSDIDQKKVIDIIKQSTRYFK